MPAPRRAILTDITDRELDPKKKHELDKSGRLVAKQVSDAEPTVVEVQAAFVESKEETVVTNLNLPEQEEVVVATVSEEKLVEPEEVKEYVPSVVEPKPQLDAEKPKSRFKSKKKAQSDS